MKESEFIELLNLYVDHEIGAEDAKRLEAEVATDPARRETYRQYCSIQKACTLLADRFQEPAPATNAISARPAARRWVPMVPAAAIALAACIALVFAVRSRISAPAHVGQAASDIAAQEGLIRQADLRSIASDNAWRELVPAFSVRELSLNANEPASEGIVSAAGRNQGASLAWIAQLQMQSVQQDPAAQVNFKPSTEFLAPDDREDRPSSEPQEPAEMVAFRFQR